MMAIYSFNENKLFKVETTTFNDEGILERQHLQLALKNQINVIAPNCLVISEEFSEWTGSKFVEDIARDVAKELLDDDNITWFSVSAENFESIHNHSAYAYIEKAIINTKPTLS
jgi:hypothetical protein